MQTFASNAKSTCVDKVFVRFGHINVASRVFTRNTAPPTGGHVFQRTGTSFELNQHILKTNILINFKLDRGIIGTNLLTKLHEDQSRNVASRVFTRKTAPPSGGFVFQRTGTTFVLNQFFIKTNILTNFELDRGIIRTHVLTKFHEDRTRNIRNTAPPSGGHVFQQTGFTFELNQHIIKTNILTNFELDRGIIGKNLLTVYKPNVDDGRTDDGQRPVTKAHLSNQVS
ncbi:hypothetical protein DPMN_108033 [Dreissena polymorpha]|uniref:Uncharacterized protein n=1 Tax=Dreissena polymorpha TaxID=45954 RepID=A0A9D4K843_DREPO|nr:hypothetical protein DPMN_108033 [Dreissena polymorpha]